MFKAVQPVTGTPLLGLRFKCVKLGDGQVHLTGPASASEQLGEWTQPRFPDALRTLQRVFFLVLAQSVPKYLRGTVILGVEGVQIP